MFSDVEYFLDADGKDNPLTLAIEGGFDVDFIGKLKER